MCVEAIRRSGRLAGSGDRRFARRISVQLSGVAAGAVGSTEVEVDLNGIRRSDDARLAPKIDRAIWVLRESIDVAGDLSKGCGVLRPSSATSATSWTRSRTGARCELGDRDFRGATDKNQGHEPRVSHAPTGF